MENRTFTVTTRSSKLAYTQTQIVIAALKHYYPHIHFEILPLKTKGDTVQNKALSEFSGQGVFVKELENALLEEKADFAVHSLKDIPSKVPSGLIFNSFLQRGSPQDVLITRDGSTYETLKKNAKIGTGSPRRIVQLAEKRPDFHFTGIRGNLDTRLKKLYDRHYDAIIVAAAGMQRMGREIDTNQLLPIDACLPAIGQGTIAIECREDDKNVQELVRPVNDRNSEIAARTERRFMDIMEGGCRLPLAAYAQIEQDTVSMDTMVGDYSLTKLQKYSQSGAVDNYNALAEKMAQELKHICERENIKIRG